MTPEIGGTIMWYGTQCIVEEIDSVDGSLLVRQQIVCASNGRTFIYEGGLVHIRSYALERDDKGKPVWQGIW